MRYNRYNVRMLRRLPVLAALAGVVALTQLGGAIGAYSGANGVIAYTCGANICQVNADGTGEQQIVTGGTQPSWAAGGAKIAFITATTGIDVATYANGTVSNAQPVSGVTGVTDVALSPDGTTVAYVINGQLFLNNTAGTSSQPQTNATGFVKEVSWSPDGSELAYASGTTGVGPFEICILNLGSGAGPCLGFPASGASDRHPNWSPDGFTIVFDSTRGGVSPPTLWTVNSSLFSAPSQLGGSSNSVSGTDPAYSPDGTKIVYVNSTGSLSTVTSSGGSQTAISNTSGGTQPDWQPLPPPPPPPPPAPTAPKNITYPTIILPFGRTQPLVGDTLFSTVGSWSGQSPITFTYQWKRCIPPGNFGACFDIPKATFSFYTLTDDDFGSSIRVQVTATNSLGSSSQNSEASATVTEVAPRARVTPPIVGQNVEGQTLSVGTGTWDGTALKFTYSWRRCDPFGNFDTCVQIAGATSSTYIQTADDIGHALRVWITATNKAGSDFTITNHTFPTIPKPHFAPSSTAVPAVTGVAGVGEALTASSGTWGGDLPITFVYAWQRCDATGSACRNLVGQTKRKYTVTSRDVGYTLRVLVTATNQYGTASATSQATDTVPAVPKHHRGRRIVGTSGNDYLAGGPYDDVISGRAGNDTIHAGAGYDVLYGGPGNDILDGGPGRDRIFGGPGSDTILAVDNERDFVDCGPGNDRAVVDASDTFKNCEKVEVMGQTTTPPPSPTPTPSP